jgi:hypothetical protein
MRIKLNTIAAAFALAVTGAYVESKTEVLFGSGERVCAQNGRYLNCILDRGIVGGPVQQAREALDHPR